VYPGGRPHRALRFRAGADEEDAMTAAERALWQRAQRRALGLQPEIAAAILLAFQIIRDSMTDAQLATIRDDATLDRFIREALTDEILARAFFPYRQRIRSAVERTVAYVTRELPKAGKIDGVVAISFDYLNPKVITAVRALESKVVTTLSADVREVVRAYVENGLRDGVAPAKVARSLRSVIGLAPNQETAVRNFEAALRGEGRNPLSYQLRDKRFDRTIAKGELTESQVTTQVAAYRKKMVAFNANTNARTAASDSFKLGQRLAWEDAIDKGIVARGDLTKKWIGVMDARERPEHVAMQNETVGFDDPFSNGEMIPGDSTYNCRCIAVYRQR
jgi:hypothetical protein